MRLGFLSDIHITNNTTFLEHAVHSVNKVCQEEKVDKLFIAGDISNNYNMTIDFVKSLNKKGLETYFILGNHEYWSINYENSLKIDYDKYINNKVIDINKEVVVVGINGFFDYSFVRETNNIFTNDIDVNIDSLYNNGFKTFDLKMLKIKKEEYEYVFNNMTKTLIKNLKENKGKHIIVLMHHVPHEDFIIYNNDKIWTSNNAFMGSKKYHTIFQEHGVNQVIFGHTHTKFNKVINGIIYSCNPVGYKNYEFNVGFEERLREMLNVTKL